jgi:hypothetical protein
MFVMDCYVGCLSVADMSAALIANRAGLIRRVLSPLVPLPQPGAAIWSFRRGEIVATVAAVLSTRFHTFDEMVRDLPEQLSKILESHSEAIRPQPGILRCQNATAGPAM